MTPYRQRAFRHLGLHEVGGLQLKCYRIDLPSGAAQRSVSAGAYQRALSYVDAHGYRAVTRSGLAHHGLGYLIVHFGAQRTWLLLHWWHGEDIALAHLASAAPAGADLRCEDQAPFHACVWEHVVIHHERNAWVRHQLSTAPDASAYLADRLPDGHY